MSVVVKNLTKSIKGSPVLQSVSVEAPEGEVTGLAGVNGSGKTMLMRAMAGFIRPDSGTVSIDGKELWKDIEFPPSIGLLIENPAFLPRRTSFENLRILASIKNIATDDDIRQMLDFVGLDPDDRRHFSKYSLGMKQRLGLAAAALEKPRVVLLDEPTNALDESGVRMAQQLVSMLRDEGSIVVLACHDASVLRGLSDQIYHLAEGHLDGYEDLREAKRS